MKINILLFGQLTDITGSGTITMESVEDTDSLVAALCRDYPALLHSSYVIAVDKQIVSQNTALHDKATVALMPPFSGG